MRTKNFTKILLALLCIFIISGCGEQDTADTSTTQAVDVTGETGTESVEEIKYADMLPEPKEIFVDGTISVTDGDGGTAYIFNVTGYNEGEYEVFVSKCKELGFDNVSYETSYEKGKDFVAYTSDGTYWVQVNLDTENNII